MSHEKHGTPEPRDTTLARLMAGALEAQSANASSSACPGAELLAAYADHALEADEAARWEPHFAECGRCQKVLAVLTVSADDPLTQQEIARLGTLVGKAVVPTESPTTAQKIAKPPKRWATWQWLLPAFGIAAAAALWIALRPAVPRLQLSVGKMAAPAPSEQQTQIAPATVPAPSETSSQPRPNAANLSAEQGRPLNREAPPQAKESVEDADELSDAKKLAPVAPLEANRVAPVITRAGEPAAGLSGAAPPVPTASGDITLPVEPPLPSAAQQLQQPRALAGPANATAQSSPEGGRNSQPPNAQKFAAMAKAITLSTAFAAPDRSAEWRIGPNGSIERSTDKGSTWQRQSSGVNTDLLAGLAVSSKIAWIAGRSGVVLKTTDGEHWQRTAVPAMSPPALRDFGGIQATDALHATVTSSDGTRFTTSDGGQTWTPQP